MLRNLARRFPFGLAPFILLVVAVVSGLYIILNPAAEREATLRVWTFATAHRATFERLVPEFERRNPGTTIDLQLVHMNAVSSRLRSAFWADLDVPDVVEIEISRIGGFFRGPVEEVGFIDLTPRLKESGLYERIVPNRLAPYSNRGRIYGLPKDIHPVMLAYRRDILEAEGVDVNQIQTWDDFVKIGRKLTIPGERYMIMMAEERQDHMEPLLFQRGGGYVNKDGNLTMDSEVVLETLKWYVPLVAGPKRIASDLGQTAVLAQAIEKGFILFYFCPDWQSKVIQREVPRASGKMALMPLPAAEPGGRRTSTWGGTTGAITKKCRDKDTAWKLLNMLYYDHEFLAQRYRDSNVIPPIKDAWDMPVYDEPREYWSGQPIGRLYCNLAPHVPAQYTSPYIEIIKGRMSAVVSACTQYYRKNGDNGFAEFAAKTLKKETNEVRRVIARNPY